MKENDKKYKALWLLDKERIAMRHKLKYDMLTDRSREDYIEMVDSISYVLYYCGWEERDEISGRVRGEEKKESQA